MPHTAYIGIGSNLGDRTASCHTAVERLRNAPRTRVVHCSTFAEYPALTLSPHESQSPYVNGVVQMETALDPLTLLTLCQTIEHSLGRTRPVVRWAPRIIDLDLLAYDDLILNDLGLTLPHPELHKRRFVLEPLAEIAPTWVHPRLGKTAEQLIQVLEQLDSLFDEQIFSEWHNPRDTDYDKL